MGMFDQKLTVSRDEKMRLMKLDDGGRVAVIGGGPAGSFFSYFLLDLAERAGLDLQLDIYEPRNFTTPGPAGCNMCGGIISESLVQHLAAEGIALPPTVVERGIDSYVLHMPEGNVRIDTPLQEKRIAAVHRGAGPRGLKETKWGSFDGYLLDLAQSKGARVVHSRVEDVDSKDGRIQVRVRDGAQPSYDLLTVAAGINSASLKLFEKVAPGYAIPKSTKTYIGEFLLGQDVIEKQMGSSMHVFLLDLPRLEFAALIPKGDYVTLCLLGDDIDAALVKSFLDSSVVRECMPFGWTVPQDYCHCSPRINVAGAAQPFSDRVVFIGDSGVTRLYKDGIGAAYRTAKSAAVTAVFQGISAEAFQKHYLPACRSISTDNAIGKMIFFITRMQQSIPHDRRGILRMVSGEQRRADKPQRMSTVMWDLFTGSAPYRDVFQRTIHPAFLGRLVWEVLAAEVEKNKSSSKGGSYA